MMNEIKVLKEKNFKKDYASGKVSTMTIEAFPIFFETFYKRQKNETIDDFKKSLTRNHVIYADNRKLFLEIFGKKLFTFKTSFNFHCWLLQFKSFKVLLLTAAEKGTCIEIIKNDNLKDNDIVEFYNEFYKLLKKYVDKK